MHGILFEGLKPSNDVVDLISQLIHVVDLLILRLQFCVNCIKYIFNCTIYQPVRCTVNNSVSGILNTIFNQLISMNI